MNILFTCAGRRNYLLRYFREELKGRGKIFAADMSDTAPALQEADVTFTVPAVADKNYIPSLLDICSTNNIDLVISLNDMELPILAASKKDFENQGTKLLVSSSDVIDVCFDKLKTCEYLAANGFTYPTSYTDLSAAQNALKAGQLFFPLIVKPRWGSASTQIYKVSSEAELELAFKLAGIQLQKTSLQVDESLICDSILIQECLPGDEYGLDILNDMSGNVCAVYVKRKLEMRAGETDKSYLVEEPLLADLGARIGTTLRHIGNLDCDVFYDGEKAVVLELNPRFGGGYPFSHTLGANYPRAIVQWYQGLSYDCNNFEKNISSVVSKCDDLLFVGR